jgi:xanthine dehydrogenase accessory factor
MDSHAASVTEFVVLIRGAGEMATGVAHRLAKCGFRVLLTEIEQPLAIRRSVAYAECVFTGTHTVESIPGIRVQTVTAAHEVISAGRIPVLVDPQLHVARSLLNDPGTIIVDGRMLKVPPVDSYPQGVVAIGLGPGFVAPHNARYVIETNRGHDLGRVIETGRAEANTGVPAEVQGVSTHRVIYAPGWGAFRSSRKIGEAIQADDIIGQVDSEVVKATLSGVLRGLLHDGIPVSIQTKVADIDPRGRADYCYQISDKARAIAGGVLEAVLRIMKSR